MFRGLLFIVVLGMVVSVPVQVEAATVTPGVLIEWVASDEAGGGTPAVWESSLPGDINYVQDPNAASLPVLTSVSGSGTTITHAFDFNGTNQGFHTKDPSGGADNFQNVAGDPTNGPATVELWVKPRSLGGGEQILWEAGGTGDGSGLYLDNGDVLFRAKNQGRNATATAALTSASDFVQIVGVFDTGVDNNIELYIDGVLSAVMAASGGNFNDWAGTDGADGDGLGTTEGNGRGGDLGDLGGFGFFDGQIGIVRLYDFELTDQQVADNFDALSGGVPEPATALLGLLGMGGLAMRRRRAI